MIHFLIGAVCYKPENIKFQTKHHEEGEDEDDTADEDDDNDIITP